ncbi:MAG TPA: hypothetical protein VJ623_12480 [Holophagaceae bacterium]|nr:hypothetical protein [Holophagaceae bacterium]
MPLPVHSSQPFGALPWMLFLGCAVMVPLTEEAPRPVRRCPEDTLPGIAGWPVDDQGEAVTLFV